MPKIVDGRLKKNYRLANVSAQAVQYGIPLTYIFYEYQVFGSQNAYKISMGWLIILLGMGYFIFKKNIKQFITDYNTQLGSVAQIGKWSAVFLGGALILALASLWITGAIYFLLVVGGSNLASLPLYTIYYGRKNEYDRYAKAITEREEKLNIEGVSL